MKEHTPGPFKIVWKDGSAIISADDGHGKIATIHLRKTYSQNTSELRGNALLFSASPDLADALESLLRGRDFGDRDPVEKALAALNKAGR